MTMWTPEQWRRIEALFLAATEVEPTARKALLERECVADDAMRAAVEQLLAGDDAAEDRWLDQGVGTALHGPDALLGSRVGCFELVERIAEGGMGTVYRARRVDVDFAQEVAVKVLRLGLSTPAMRERFARERRTLARLSHPHVARLLDGGTTSDGVPFIAMELVDGVPLDRFADSRKLPVRARLQLFVLVCRAVQFAHQNLVVHLDLKPSNILVDALGSPRLLDFGVAALLTEIHADGAESAAIGSRPLTPGYASPEQLRGEPVSTAADVYSLGVVLHELLTGTPPFPVAGGDLVMAREVLAADPPRPSATFRVGRDAPLPDAEVRAERRGATPRDLVRLLRGDIDCIVARAMAKETAHRYGSCQEMAEDIERHLGGFPILARDLGVLPRVAKFVRRNALAVGATLAFLLSLIAGILATLHMAAVARDERDVAAAARRDAEQQRDAAAAARERSQHEAAHARIEASSSHIVAQFLGDMFLSSGLLTEPEERTRVLATIERRAAQARRQHQHSPHLLANLLDALGRACTAIDAFERSEALLREGAAIREQTFGAASLEHALSLGSLGQLSYRQGRFGDAVISLREAYRLHRECELDVHTDVAQAANDLAAAERANGDTARARELHREALELRRTGGDSVLVAESLNNLANSEPDLTRARRYLQEALELRRSVLGTDDPLTVQSEANLGMLCMRVGEFSTAREHLQAAVAKSRELHGLGADGLAIALRGLAYAQLRLGEVAVARSSIEEALTQESARFVAHHPRVLACLEVRAKIDEADRRWPDAVATWRDIVERRRANGPAGDRQILLAQTSLGTALIQAGEVAAGVDLLREVEAGLLRLGSLEGELADARLALALGYEALSDHAAAERELLAAWALEPQLHGGGMRAEQLRRHVHAFYLRRGRTADAARFEPKAMPATK